MSTSDDRAFLLNQLDRLLDRDLTKIQTWERNYFDEFAGAKADRFVLCRAVGLGYKILNDLHKLGM